MLKKFFTAVGEYIILLGKSIQKPQKMNVFRKLLMREINDLGVNSFGLVIFTSIFVGAVVAIQMFNNFFITPTLIHGRTCASAYPVMVPNCIYPIHWSPPSIAHPWRKSFQILFYLDFQ